MIITALADIGQPYSCNQWNNFSPNVTTLIIDDDDATIFNWFNSENGFPSTVFIDQDMTVQYKANYINNYYMKGYIDDLLSDCGDDCTSDPSAALFEYSVDGLTVTFIDLSQEINPAIITDWNGKMKFPRGDVLVAANRKLHHHVLKKIRTYRV